MTWVRGLSEIAGRFARDGCFHDVRSSTIARPRQPQSLRDSAGSLRKLAGTVWRLAHPGWRAPARTALGTGIACAKPAALAGALAAGLSVLPAATASHFGYVEYARGGSAANAHGVSATLARPLPMPPGGSRAVGGTFVPDPDSLADARESQQDLRLVLAVPEPASLAGLAVGALLAIWARKVRKIKSVRR